MANVSWWGGGSGTFSEVVVLSEPAPGELAAKMLVAGGDRCFDGIVDVKVVGPDAIEVESNLTATGFVALGDGEPPQRLMRALPDCAACAA